MSWVDMGKRDDTSKAAVTKRIKMKGLELGFSHVGIIPCRDFDEYAEVYRSRPNYRLWVDNPSSIYEGCYPSKYFPQGKSIVCATYGFSDIDFPKELLDFVGRIYLARCYVPVPEIIAGRRFTAMAEFLQSLGMDVYAGPIEPPVRYVAFNAGIVWYANNNFVGTDEDGTFIVVYTWIVDEELEYDEPTPIADGDGVCDNGCPEGCTICIDACPTNAIVEPRELNPLRCILMNDLTPVVTDVADDMAQHIHGCDVCQVVCPRNRDVLKKPKRRDPFLDALVDDFSLEKILLMDSFEDDYYKDVVYPIMYNYIRDIDIFRKSAAVAMGNSGKVEYIPALEQAAEKFSEFPSGAAAQWALEKLQNAR